MSEITAILITGQPGVGKTTLIQQIIERFPNASGFYTREVREGNVRMGFEIVTLDGEIGTLATQSVDIIFENQVDFEAYKVNIDTVNLLAIPAVEIAAERHQLVIIDEIGPMEIFSPDFQNMVMHVLDNDKLCVLGTIVEREYEFADQVKQHPRVKIMTLNEQNREDVKIAVTNWLHKNL